ncbi:metallophosphoesterase family protein [Ornithinibacillus californiensis]|uniref:hypothetical protein n=1 Tax=Ornithinibacillus californiensis TaxID=161536 RepID=UPI00069DBE63|nr:hypothetical protein [Ornithinibacillus californiensis]
MIQVGKHCYTYLLHISPSRSQFPLDCFIAYNVSFSTRYEQFNFADLDLLNKDNPHHITYGELEYPTFLIQDETPSTILYGSCRKPHGKNESVIGESDDYINQHATNLQERPNGLFLMGDQIYADDVADPLFYKLTTLAHEIIGEKQKQLQNIEPRLQMSPFRNSIEQLNGRQFVMENFAKFTSHHASNHLIRFQEYVTMYLMTLGPALWENASNPFPSFEELIESGAYYLFYSKKRKRKHRKEIKKLKKRYEDQVKEITNFIPSLPAMRRVLANTPTYMIFDDHDITDDWNISQEWMDNVYQSKLGKHVVTNALSAYWLFQGWGNDPVAMKPKLTNFSSQFHYHIKYSCFTDQWTDYLPTIRSWCFMTPTTPQAIFLDIRTMREFDYHPKPLRVGSILHEGKTAPQLIGNNGWNIVTQTLVNSNWKSKNPLIIVSPTPVYGIGIIESFLNRFVYPLRAIGLPVRYALDFEAWKYNAKGFNILIQHLMKWNPNPCIILSGDVHYANSVRSNLYIQRKKQLTLHQFTSSPIHNMSFSGIWGQLLKLVVAFNSFTRKRKTITRYYDKEKNLTIGKVTEDKKKILSWYEDINYLSSVNGKIMHNQNNIGLLTITKNYLQNKLLKRRSVVSYKKTDMNRE